MTAQEQHASFALGCFNEVWGLLEKDQRTGEEDRLMREMAHASLFHWLCRDDCTAKNISIGLWQISRVHAVLGQDEPALRYARECIALSDESQLPVFYRAYAYEAAARGALLAGDVNGFREALAAATDLAENVVDDEERRMLNADLTQLAALAAAATGPRD